MLVSRGKEKALEKGNVFSLDLKTATELLLRTVFGSEYCESQAAGAEYRKAQTTKTQTIHASQ